ncbi:hypothetical protein PISMIDRAFT_19971 [Pisolithus microcarpus 441]|uniref:Uncharacterized protein n=1 Tax=Pisolithus microcarpus 441 TaxID=765257 RepID=A0A0C9YKN9_9AGAM|nr:hypothetical protein PISMIDRAFT_19971 [Pisolithus microcarpus 441]
MPNPCLRQSSALCDYITGLLTVGSPPPMLVTSTATPPQTASLAPAESVSDP